MLTYKLSADLVYRRESFGGLLFSQRTKETKFYNHLAAFALECFKTPNDTSKVISSLRSIGGDDDAMSDFVKELISHRTIVAASDNDGLPKAFFTDVKEFPGGRLYAPLAAELELTLKCMRRCAYCAYDSSPDISTTGEISAERCRSLFQELADSGVCYVRFTGGDPFTRTDCLDIIESADEYHFGLAIASDLTILSESDVRRLSRLKNLTALQTTLDGPDAATADYLRGPGSFSRVMRGVRLLREQNIPVIVGTILTVRNSRHVYEIAKLLQPLQVMWCISPLYNAGRGRNLADLIPSDGDLASAFEQFGRAIDEGLVTAADPAWREIASPLGPDLRRLLWESQPWLVRSPDRILRIDPYGRCYTSIHLKEVVGEAIYAGSIYDKSITSIWGDADILNNMRAQRHRNRYFGDVIDIRLYTPTKGRL